MMVMEVMAVMKVIPVMAVMPVMKVMRAFSRPRPVPAGRHHLITVITVLNSAMRRAMRSIHLRTCNQPVCFSRRLSLGVDDCTLAPHSTQRSSRACIATHQHRCR